MILSNQGSLLGLLQSKKPSVTAQRRCLGDALAELGLGEEDELSPICVAYALMKLRVQPEEVSRLLSWQEFEGLAGALLRASGYQVRENVYLTKPRAQIDLIATGPSLVLSVDCKHYKREQGHSLLVKFARAQLERSALLRRKTQGIRPIASVILSMSEPEGRFVDGVAVVPIRTLRSFLTTIDSYSTLLDLK
jgi:Restriction endonuclease